MRLFFSFIFLILISFGVWGVPADGVVREYRQPDGTTVNLRLYGDEFLHFLMTTDGFIVSENEFSQLCYCEFKDNRLVSTGIAAHNPGQRADGENKFLADRKARDYDKTLLDSIANLHDELIKAANDRRATVQTRALGVPSSYVGQKKGLVLLVEFPNQPMSSAGAHADYDRMFNSPGYSDNNHAGSVYDYFYDQSYGLFELTFDVVGPLTVSQNFGYYGTDSTSGNIDKNVREMVEEACILADEFVDYKDYDWDGDGMVDQVFIVYAGYGQATGGVSYTIWPHESYLADGLVLDNVAISQYACSNELYGTTGSPTLLMGIGVACHEFSHCLGLPDLYDTDYSGAYGMNYWGLMNSGSYNGPKGIGEVPCGYTAYERWFAGWLEFTDLEESQKIEDLKSLEQEAVAYRIFNRGNTNEFYTFENRQPDKWFRYLSHYEAPNGLLITHIDYDFRSWALNRVNPSQSHQRMSPIVADNDYGLSLDSMAGDLFPGANNVTELTNTSHEEGGGRLFNKNLDGSYNMNVSILNISEADGTIAFDVIFDEELPIPTALEAKDINQTSFMANWTDSHADSYSLEIKIVRKSKPYIDKTIIVEDIFNPYYMADVGEAEFCIYRVRANKNGVSTQWSNSVVVQLNDSNSIDNIFYDADNTDNADTTIYGLNGIKIQNPSKGTLGISNGKKFICR